MKENLTLWEVQLGEYPDSVRIGYRTLLNLPDTHTLPASTKPMRSLEAMLVHERDLAILRQQCYRWISVALATAVEDEDGEGVFYACGKREDGSYRYLGYRYGVEGHQYLSNYPADVIRLPE